MGISGAMVLEHVDAYLKVKQEIYRNLPPEERDRIMGGQDFALEVITAILEGEDHLKIQRLVAFIEVSVLRAMENLKGHE